MSVGHAGDLSEHKMNGDEWREGTHTETPDFSTLNHCSHWQVICYNYNVFRFLIKLDKVRALIKTLRC